MSDKAYIIVYGIRASDADKIDSCKISDNLYVLIDDARKEARRGIEKFLGTPPPTTGWHTDPEDNETFEFLTEGNRIGRCEIRRLPILPPTQ